MTFKTKEERGKHMRETLSSRVLRISLYIAFGLGLLGTSTLPFMLEYYIGFFYDAYYPEPGYRTFLIIFIMSVAVPGLWIILEMIWMLSSIPRDPFVMRNVRALSRTGIILFVISAMFFAKCFVFITFLTVGCGFLFLICAFFAFTLSNLFRQAVDYKEENDLTI